ncbi:hypothetical protein BBFL7_00548 [Flavobacteria bacterium BBFL7]|nr:hypothetical protein BBFL7_00548 [Flavobacteria bacterium BBFL7]
MMDQLDILKEKWNTQDKEYPRVSADHIKKMLAQKSTSIVKWLLIIAIIEFTVMSSINFLYSFLGSPDEFTRELMDSNFMKISWAIHIIAIIYFIYLFYKNYKNISATQPTRSLMKNIIKTRKTMKWYIWYNIIGGFISGMVTTIYMLNNHPLINELMESGKMEGHETMFYVLTFLILTVIYIIFLGFIYLIYMLIYGILLKRLKNNYEELKRMEV